MPHLQATSQSITSQRRRHLTRPLGVKFSQSHVSRARLLTKQPPSINLLHVLQLGVHSRQASSLPWESSCRVAAIRLLGCSPLGTLPFPASPQGNRAPWRLPQGPPTWKLQEALMSDSRDSSRLLQGILCLPNPWMAQQALLKLLQWVQPPQKPVEFLHPWMVQCIWRLEAPQQVQGLPQPSSSCRAILQNVCSRCQPHGRPAQPRPLKAHGQVASWSLLPRRSCNLFSKQRHRLEREQVAQRALAVLRCPGPSHVDRFIMMLLPKRLCQRVNQATSPMLMPSMPMGLQSVPASQLWEGWSRKAGPAGIATMPVLRRASM